MNILTNLEEFTRYLTEIEPRFIQVNIETNNICNRTCHFCLYGVRSSIPANPMSASLYFQVIEQLAEINFSGRLSLFSTNEPLTDKRIYEFIRYASIMLPDCCHTLASNGDLLNRERIDRLFQSGLDFLLLNSYDDKALQNNNELYKYITIQYPGKIQNCDRTAYLNWVSRAGHIKRYAKNPVTGFCDLPNYALYINSRGKVLSCCHDFDENNVVGDLTQQTIKQIWYGLEFDKLRRSLNQGDRSVSELCKRCDHVPDLDQFLWNYQLQKLCGKDARPFSRKPDAHHLAKAQAIKAKYLERENRPHVVQVMPSCNTAMIDQHRSAIPNQGKQMIVSSDTTIQHWRTRHLQLLNGADRVFTPSQDVKQRISRYSPAANLVFAPHPERGLIDRWPSPAPLASTEPLRIVVLGALGQAKGADVLEACALDARRRSLPLAFHLLGYAQRNLAVEPNSRLQIHGSYDDEDSGRRLTAMP